MLSVACKCDEAYGNFCITMVYGTNDALDMLYNPKFRSAKL